MKFERGFKSYANKLAIQVRQELGLAEHAPLDPWMLAKDLGIPVVTISELADSHPEIAPHVDYLAGKGSSVFSAITVFSGHRRVIVHNDAHAPNRQRSDLAHELSHTLLAHPPHPLFGSDGDRVYDRRMEGEASWMGPVLLVPNEAAHWIVDQRMDDNVAARHYGVSHQLLEFRLQTSGAKRRMKRWGGV